MPAFNTYPKAVSLTGEEILVLTDATGLQTINATASQIAGAPVVSKSSGEFYQDQGAHVSRMGDRLLVGAAAKNPAESDREASARHDWLSQVMGNTSIGPWAVQTAQCASLASFGSSAFVAGSRTSDAKSAKNVLGSEPSSIGIASWGVADDTSNPTSTTAYAYYGEAWRLSGVNYQPTFAMELEAVNMGGEAVGISTPYAPNIGGGVYGIQLGVGGGQTDGSSDAAAGLVFVSNPDRWKTGIIFGATALAGTNGHDDGYASAVAMSRNQALEWHTPETVSGVTGLNVGAFIRSTVSEAEKGVRQEFEDDAIVFSNISGDPLFSIGSIAAPRNTLNIQAGAGAQAAGIYVQKGADGSPNLGLFPSSGGELQIGSPVTNSGAALPTSVDGGFLHININGSDYRIPLFTPAQTGG